MFLLRELLSLYYTYTQQPLIRSLSVTASVASPGGGNHQLGGPGAGAAGGFPGAMQAAGLSELTGMSLGFPWAGSARGKPRRGMMRRAVFSDLQRRGLEKRFQQQKYISKPDRKKLAEKLGLKDSQVSVTASFCFYGGRWFWYTLRIFVGKISW